MPFFVTFVLRTISWKFILTDEGILLGPLKEIGLLPQSFHILGTAPAVIFGLVYNYLPFMVLPIYVALERSTPRRRGGPGPLRDADRGVPEGGLPSLAARRLCGSAHDVRAASSDYVNSEILGSSSTTMIGQVIQTQYLKFQGYPTASALSFTLMAILLVGIFAYARMLGTEDVMKVAAR